MKLSKTNTVLLLAIKKGYYLDRDGNVFNKSGKQMKANPDSRGYRSITIHYNNTCSTLRVHKIQAYHKYKRELFNPEMVIRHLNGNCLDNSYKNIKLGTQSENMMDIPEKIRKWRSKQALKARLNGE